MSIKLKLFEGPEISFEVYDLPYSKLVAKTTNRSSYNFPSKTDSTRVPTALDEPKKADLLRSVQKT